MDTVEQRLQAAGLVLPPPIVPAGNYVPFTRSGNQLFIAGQLCYGPDGKVASQHIGQVGVEVSVENATTAVQCCALNILAQAKAALGSLERIRTVAACAFTARHREDPGVVSRTGQAAPGCVRPPGTRTMTTSISLSSAK